MPIPTSLWVETKGRMKLAGLVVEVYPSTARGLSCEIQTATANSTLSSRWNSVILPPTSAAQWRYTIQIPQSTKLTYVKARHPAGAGYAAGPFTPVISARPKLIPDVIRPFYVQQTYAGNVEIPSGADIYLTSAKTVKVGSQVTTGTLTKTLRINFGEFVPDGNASKWQYSDSAGFINSSAAALFGRAPLLLPPGVQLVNFRARMYRKTTAAPSTAKAYLLEVTDGPDTTAGPTATIVKTLTHATKGYKTLTTGTTITINAAKSYHIDVILRNSTAGGAGLLWVELDYKMQTYAKTI